MVSPQRTPNVLYEPRALWEVRQIQAEEALGSLVQDGPTTVHLDRTRWRNGRRHTLVLTHLLLDGINYALTNNDNATAASTTRSRNARSALAGTRVRISSPFRSYFSRNMVIFDGFDQQPVHEPPLDFDEGGLDYASGLFGICRWDFRDTCPEGPLWIPNKSKAQFDMSGWAAPALADAADLNRTDVTATLMFDECPIEGYSLREPGTARMGDRTIIEAVDSPDVFPAGPNPFPVDAFGVNTLPSGVGATHMWAHKLLTPKQWRGDEAARGVSHKELRGFAVAIDQIGYDDEIQAGGGGGQGGGGGALGGADVVAPISTRVGVRCRMTGGGSGEWWWEPGAPLSLVSPSLGPASVHRLSDPIVLPKGDALDVEVEIPTPIDGLIAEVPLRPQFTIGVSLVGYAIVEG